MMKLGRLPRSFAGISGESEGETAQLACGDRSNVDTGLEPSYEFGNISEERKDENAPSNTPKKKIAKRRSISFSLKDASPKESTNGGQGLPRTLNSSYGGDIMDEKRNEDSSDDEKDGANATALSKFLGGAKALAIGHSGRSLAGASESRRGLMTRNSSSKSLSKTKSVSRPGLVKGMSFRKSLAKDTIDENQENCNNGSSRRSSLGRSGSFRRSSIGSNTHSMFRRSQKGKLDDDDLNKHIGEIKVSKSKHIGEIKVTGKVVSTPTDSTKADAVERKSAKNSKSLKQESRRFAATRRNSLDSRIGEIKITKKPPQMDNQTTSQPTAVKSALKTGSFHEHRVTSLQNISEHDDSFDKEEMLTEKQELKIDVGPDTQPNMLDNKDCLRGSDQPCQPNSGEQNERTHLVSTDPKAVERARTYSVNDIDLVKTSSPLERSHDAYSSKADEQDRDEEAKIEEEPSQVDVKTENVEGELEFQGQGKIPHFHRKSSNTFSHENVVFQFFLDKENPVIWVVPDEDKNKKYLELNIIFATKVATRTKSSRFRVSGFGNSTPAA